MVGKDRIAVLATVTLLFAVVGSSVETALMFEPRARPDDSPIGDKARVVGIWFGDDRYKAYPLEALAAVGGEVTEAIADKTVVVKLENPHSAYAETPEGRPVRVVHTYWFAWHAFHPDTELFWPEAMEEG